MLSVLSLQRYGAVFAATCALVASLSPVSHAHPLLQSVQEFKSSIYMKPQKVRATKRSLLAAAAAPSRTLLQSLPTAVDWRAVGKVTPVKNQYICGKLPLPTQPRGQHGWHAVGLLVKLGFCLQGAVGHLQRRVPSSPSSLSK